MVSLNNAAPPTFIHPRASATAPKAGMLGTYRVSVVVPALNEAQNLEYVLPRIPAWVDEIILVDGHSTDGTPEVAQRVCPRIRIVTQERKGKGEALRVGFAAATGSIIVMLDADGSTDPAEIPAFIGPLLAGADFVKGSRFLQGGGTADMSWFRWAGNWFFTKIVQFFHGGKYSDLCYGYNAFWSRVLPELQLDGDGFEIETVMNVRALRAGLKIVEVPSFERPRIHGTSHLRTVPDGWRVLKAIARETHTGWFGTKRRKSFAIKEPAPILSPSSGGYAIVPFDQHDSNRTF